MKDKIADPVKLDTWSFIIIIIMFYEYNKKSGWKVEIHQNENYKLADETRHEQQKRENVY